ncbi:MAG: TatD family hydrolase [Elusimicrobiota bacterium]
MDTHAHLLDPSFDADRPLVLERARAAGVCRIVEIADEPEGWERALGLCASLPGRLYCSLGMHPYYADRWRDGHAQSLRRAAGSPGVVAAGEFGLDYARSPVPRETQRRELPRMLAAAQAAGLPVVLHCREAYPDLLSILREFYRAPAPPPPARLRGVLHCFSGSTAEAEAAVALGFAIGVDGPVTYPKNDRLRGAIAAAGLSSIVLETDSPYLPVQSERGKRNEPAAVVAIAAAIAKLFNVGSEEVARATTTNAQALYRFSSEG